MRRRGARINPDDDDFRPNTAIVAHLRGHEFGKKGSHRPWSQGPGKQFDVGAIGAATQVKVFDNVARMKQAEVLLNLYEGMGGHKWLYSNGWAEALAARRRSGMDGIDPSSMKGVSLDDATGSYVTQLALPKCDIHGILPTALFTTLTQLVSLRLNSNHLGGPLPPSLTHLHGSLEDLDLSNNGLRGALPDLATMGRLRTVRLQDNALSGPVPRLLKSARFERAPGSGAMAGLRVLNLCNNRFGGRLDPLGAAQAMPPDAPWPEDRHGKPLALRPTEAAAFEGLRQEVRARGPWPHLEELLLGQNLLTGGLEDVLGSSLPSLTHFSAPNNLLTGPLPPCAQCPRLQHLFLDHNQLTGPIPVALMACTALVTLSLSGNQLSGPLPPQVGHLTNLRDLWVSHNRLTGPLPLGGGDGHGDGDGHGGGGVGGDDSGGGDSGGGGGGGLGLGSLVPTLRVLGLVGNAFEPDPAAGVQAVLGGCLEHHDLPAPATTSDLDVMLAALAGDGGGGGGGGQGGAIQQPAVGQVKMKSITVLARDQRDAKPVGGEMAVKIAQGDQNWREIQVKMHAAEEERRNQRAALDALHEARRDAEAARAVVDATRAKRLAALEEARARRKLAVREANTSGPRIAQKLVDAADARRQREVDLNRRRREEFG